MAQSTLANMLVAPPQRKCLLQLNGLAQISKAWAFGEHSQQELTD
jgi:hypothetical protein